MKVRLLDCTLRDGGYVNNWNFGSKNIENIIASLVSAGIDFIECGFLKPCGAAGSSLFDGVSNGKNPLNTYIKDYPEQKFTLMYNAGEVDVKKLLKYKIPDNVFVRIAFRKNQAEQAFNDAGYLIGAGVNVFINPMFTNTYSQKELYYFISKMNILKPYAVCITDTSGSMSGKETLKLAKYFDDKLTAGIQIDFHSHNNLNLSFNNSLALTKINLKRGLILDCCLSGMGRGAGNLATGKIAKIIGGYNLNFIHAAEHAIISKIYRKNPWGVSYALYQSGRLMCHPDYALYLENTDVKQSDYKKILASIPEEYKYKYNRQIIQKLSSYTAR